MNCKMAAKRSRVQTIVCVECCTGEKNLAIKAEEIIFFFVSKQF